MPKESRSRMQKWPSSTLCPPNSTVTGTTHFYPVAIRSAHVICAQALSSTANPDFGGGRSQVVDGESRAEAVLTPDSLLLTPAFTAPDPTGHSLATIHCPSKDVKN